MKRYRCSNWLKSAVARLTADRVICGNGLGMAIDEKHFSLRRALKYIWQRETILNSKQKELIQNCIDQERAPESEEDLDTYQKVIPVCKSLNNLAT